MEEILHHLECMKPCIYWEKLPINWLAGFLQSTVWHQFLMPWPKEPRRATPRGSWSKLGDFSESNGFQTISWGHFSLVDGYSTFFFFRRGGCVFFFPPGTDEVEAKWFPHIAAIHSDPEEVRGMNPWLVFDMD